jgi:hypothetical protein
VLGSYAATTAAAAAAAAVAAVPPSYGAPTRSSPKTFSSMAATDGSSRTAEVGVLHPQPTAAVHLLSALSAASLYNRRARRCRLPVLHHGGSHCLVAIARTHHCTTHQCATVPHINVPQDCRLLTTNRAHQAVVRCRWTIVTCCVALAAAAAAAVQRLGRALEAAEEEMDAAMARQAGE